MPINKNALLRYNALDRCLRNRGRDYSIQELLEEVNAALAEHNSNSTGIQLRQLRSDMAFMQSEAGYGADIEMVRDGHQGIYKYHDQNFSINNSPLNATEAEHLNSALVVLQRFEGTPGFEWMSEMAPMLKSHFGIETDGRKVMAYESNVDYTGHKYLTPIFDAITNKKVIRLKYTPFGRDSLDVTLHPYFLKQFNNRWYIFGDTEGDYNDLMNLALDRIDELEVTNKKARNTKIDWDEYLYDIIGVTKFEGKPEKIELLFSERQAPYIETKPIHASQKSKRNEDGSLLVRLEMIPNFELEMHILQFGERVKVLKPASLKKKILTHLKEAIKQY